MPCRLYENARAAALTAPDRSKASGARQKCKNARAAAPTAPPAFTYGGSSYGLPFFLVLFYIIIKKEESGRAETDDRRSYGLPFFLFYIIIRRREDGGRAETIAAAHLCGSSISFPEQLPYFIKIEGIDVASLKDDRTLAVCKGKPQLPLLAV